MVAAEGSLLLALPDPCLLLVLQRCAADDQRSLFNASRSHSRLHQAAVLALRSITLHLSQQQQMDGVMVYLGKHSRHVNSLELSGDVRLMEDYEFEIEIPKFHLRELPQQSQLSSLQLAHLCLQLQPSIHAQGVLGSAAVVAALKQLRLSDCQLLDDEEDEALAAALSQLPAGLEHLSICKLYYGCENRVSFSPSVLQQLQHLTHLELDSVDIVRADEASPSLQPLQALTLLVDLRLGWLQDVVTSSMLSGMQRLTRLELSDEIEPAALAGKTQLQHLCLSSCVILGGAAGVAQLLSDLQPMQQLTHLNLHASLQVAGSHAPVSTYAALTASSKLQHLDISSCTLPAGVWQHLFPTTQLSSLRAFDVTGTRQPPTGGFAEAPEGSRLVSCCPSLRSLKMVSLRCSAALLVPLQGLSGLQTLHCQWDEATAGVVHAVCQLAGLRELVVWGSVRVKKEGSLLQLTQLQQLTMLHYRTPIRTGVHAPYWPNGSAHDLKLSGGNEPVWCQLARLHLDHRHPGVAQRAAAALAESQ